MFSQQNTNPKAVFLVQLVIKVKAIIFLNDSAIAAIAHMESFGSI